MMRFAGRLLCRRPAAPAFRRLTGCQKVVAIETKLLEGRVDGETWIVQQCDDLPHEPVSRVGIIAWICGTGLYEEGRESRMIAFRFDKTKQKAGPGGFAPSFGLCDPMKKFVGHAVLHVRKIETEPARTEE
jgi:hypothetical protein